MHRQIGYYDERSGKDCEPNDVVPQGQVIKAKSTEDTGTWHFNV